MTKREPDEKQETEEVIAWLKAQLELKSQRQLGREIHIDPSVISRNMRMYRKKKKLARPFRKKIKAIILQQRADELHRQQLKEQAEAPELVQQEGIACGMEAEQPAAEHPTDADQEEALRQQRWEAWKRERQLEDVWEQAVLSWEKKLRAAGYPVEETGGDANDVPILPGVVNLDYVDVGTAAVALLPDGYVIWRDKTVAYFREGVTCLQRLQDVAVRDGETQIEMIGNFPAAAVYDDRLPDELWRYGREGVEVIEEWRRLSDAYGHLGTGTLPTGVHPETVAGFERLISIEETSGFDFRDSRLGPDARDRLKRLRRRSVLAAIGITTAEMAWRGSKSVSRWTLFEGSKWVGVTLVVLVGIVASVGLVVELAQLWDWTWALGTDVAKWVAANRIYILLVLLGAAKVALLCYIAFDWVKKARSGRDFVERLGIVALFPTVVVLTWVTLVNLGEAYETWETLTESLRQGIQFP